MIELIVKVHGSKLISEMKDEILEQFIGLAIESGLL